MADILAVREPYASFPTIWQGAGVPSGIPDTSAWTLVDVTAAPYNADDTGATSAVSAINAAISAQSTTANARIYCPPGRYLIDGQINLNKNNILLCGLNDPTISTTAEADRTTFVLTGGTGKVYMGISSSWGTAQSITGGDYDIADTVINVASSTGYAAGNMVRIWQDNDYSATSPNPVINIFGGEKLISQVSRVVSTTATSITISPGLHFPLLASLNPQIYKNAQYRTGIGLENVYLDAELKTSSYQIQMNCVMSSWVENAYVYKTKSYGCYLNYTLQCEIRHSTFWETQITSAANQQNNAGIKLDTCSSNLIIDCIGYKQFPFVQINGFTPSGVTNGGSSGNVVAYNFGWGCGNGSSEVGLTYTSHAPQVVADLFEGNIGVKMEQDAYFGSAQQATIVRNWFTGVDIETGKVVVVVCVNINKMARAVNILGNVLGYPGYAFTVDPEYAVDSYTNTIRLVYRNGYPNLANTNYNGTAEPSTGDWWVNWDITGTLGTRTSATAGTMTVTGAGTIATGTTSVGIMWSGGSRSAVTIGTVSGSSVPFSGGTGTDLPAEGTAIQIWAGPNGFQELDLDVYNSLLLKGNYNTQDDGIPASEALGVGETIGDSYFLSVAPAFFGPLTWPPFDPTAPNLDIEAIPAGYRYTNGIDPVSGGAPAAPSSPAAATTGNRLITFSWTDNSGGEGSFEIQRTTTSGSGYIELASTLAGITSYVDVTVAPNTRYYYRVRCVNVDGNSAYTAEANDITAAASPSAARRMARTFNPINT